MPGVDAHRVCGNGHLARWHVPDAGEPLIGRERELETIQDYLAQPTVRLLTILGPPGAGKTRLSMEIAARTLAASDREVLFVLLAPIQDHSLVVPTICRALGVPEERGPAGAEGLLATVAGRRLLVVVDNVEHLLPAAPRLSEIVATCPSIQILATSRSPLNVYAERRFVLSPLAVPDAGAPIDVARLAEVPSVALFVQRARLAQHHFGLTADNAQAVAELCRRLDGLPLAIELAAARVSHLPPPALLARLDRRLALLSGGPLDAPERQRTLRAAIDWSYRLLSRSEQEVFRHLAIFGGAFTLEAAASVCRTPHVLDVVGSLVDRSLLVMREQPDGEPRFAMLETIREYALEQLVASGELEPTSQRLAEYAVGVAERAEPELISPGQRVWLDRLDQELPNLRAALAWSIRHQPELGLRLGRAVWRYWATRGYVSEGLDWLGAALESAPVELTRLRADVLHAAGNLARIRGEPDRAARLHEEGLAVRRALGDQAGVAASLGSLGVVERLRGNYERAVSLLEESLALRRDLLDSWGAGLQLTNLAQARCDLGRYTDVLALADEGIPLLRRLGDRRCLSRLLNWSGVARHGLGELDAARALHSEALRISRELGDRRGTALALNQLGSIACAQGDVQAAHARLAEAVRLYHDLGNQRDLARCLASFAHLALAIGKKSRAVQLFAAAEAAIDTDGPSLPPVEQTLHTAAISRLRARLGEASFRAAWNAGRGMGAEDAVAYAIGQPGDSAAAPPARTDEAPALTPRERQVAVLAARGLTDRQIATELVISERTAGAHIGNILAKLGLRSRAQVAVWVAARGLLSGA